MKYRYRFSSKGAADRFKTMMAVIPGATRIEHRENDNYEAVYKLIDCPLSDACIHAKAEALDPNVTYHT